MTLRSKIVPKGYVHIHEAIDILIEPPSEDGEQERVLGASPQRKPWARYRASFLNSKKDGTRTCYKRKGLRVKSFSKKVAAEDYDKIEVEYKKIKEARRLLLEALKSGIVVKGKLLFKREGYVTFDKKNIGLLLAQYRPAFASGYVVSGADIGLVLFEKTRIVTLAHQGAPERNEVQTPSDEEIRSRASAFRNEVQSLFERKYGFDPNNWPLFAKAPSFLLVDKALREGYRIQGGPDKEWMKRKPKLERDSMDTYRLWTLPKGTFRPGRGNLDARRQDLAKQLFKELGLKYEV